MTVRPRAALLLAVLLASAARPAAAAAQGTPADSARDAADSLAARLRRAEEAIAALQQQIAEQASSGAGTRSRMQLELNGRVVVNSFRNDRRVNNVDDPQFVRPDTVTLLPVAATGAAIRQTTLGLVVTAPDVLGGAFAGDMDVDFYGGQQASSGGRTFPLLRLRTARGVVRWSNAELLVGQEAPLIAGVNPISPAAIGTPNFATAGNLWLWLPQIRATIESDGPMRIGLQAAVLSSITGDPVGLFDTDADAAERSDRPAVEGRLRARWGDDRPSEVGCGGHLAWVALTGVRARTSAVACDLTLALGRVELRGEGYTGRGLRGLGGGGISQNLANTGFPLHDTGGWAQVNVDATSLVRVGAGCGTDMPDESELATNGRRRNSACAGYTIVRPPGPLFVGAEYRRIETRYSSGSYVNNHINLSFGFAF